MASAPKVGGATLRGLVFAGGLSERLGRDKAALPWGHATLLDHAVAVLAEVTGPVVVAVRSDPRTESLRSRFDCIVDEGVGLGPAAGLLAANTFDPRAAWLVLACDMPRVDAALLRQLVAARDPARSGTAFLSPVDRLPEPLCAIYEPATLTVLRERIAAGAGSGLRGLLGVLNPVLIEGASADALASVNTPADLRRFTGLQ